MAGRAGDRLGEHPALQIEHPGGQVAALAHDRAEGGAQQRRRLLLDHRDQPLPHHLLSEIGEGLGAVHGVSSCVAWRRSIQT